jgi:hypothetical protein
MKKLAFLLLLIFMSGCATPPISYYYGNYSRTLYRSKKDNTPESVAKHVATLQDIITTSEKKGIKPPPGICCEYAYVLAKANNPESERFFQLEVKNYPESERFVKFIRSEINKS